MVHVAAQAASLRLEMNVPIAIPIVWHEMEPPTTIVSRAMYLLCVLSSVEHVSVL